MDTVELFQYLRTPAIVIHVIAVVFSMGSALSSDILFSFYSKKKSLETAELNTLSILANIVFYGLVFVILSGLVIFLGDIEGYLDSSKFLAKMSIVLILLLNGYVLNTRIWPHLLNANFFTGEEERNVRRAAFVCGAISVISWISVCTLGVLDVLNMSYGMIILLYLFIIIFGVIVSLFVERREFN